MSTYRWKILNGDGVMKMKRWFGIFWRDFENFDNNINRSKHKLHELWVKMQEEKVKLDLLQKEKKSIIASVAKATGKLKGMGEPFGGQPFSGLRKPDVDAAPEDWKTAFKNAKSQGTGKTPSSFTVSDLGSGTGVHEWPLTSAEKRGNDTQQRRKGNQSNNN
jgi:hypothetical protein